MERGGVVTKIVRSDEAEITNITRYTNSQNSVREQDFIALNSGFQSWATAMANDYGLFLEIQRGGTAARKAWEKDHPGQPQFTDYVNAFDLIKVFGAGWISEPGLAFGKNAPFLPNGPCTNESSQGQKGFPLLGPATSLRPTKSRDLPMESGLAGRLNFRAGANLDSCFIMSL